MIKTYTFHLDLEKEEERNIHDKIQIFYQSFHERPFGKKVPLKHLLKYLINPPTEKVRRELQIATLRKHEKIETWVKGYNLKNQRNLSKNDFIVDILCYLKEKETDELIDYVLNHKES